jgi:hypothetical protein
MALGGSKIVARIFMVILGSAAIFWGVEMLPIFWRQAPIEGTARLITFGDSFKSQALIDLLPAIQRVEQAEGCSPAALRAVAIIRARMTDDIILSGQREQLDASFDSLRDAIRRSLACSPAEPFLWLVLYWVENARNGLNPENMKYLRMSYSLGPNEGWITLKRNPLALAVFDELPADLADLSIAEFANLLDSGFVREAVQIFEGPGWRIRDRILPRLRKVSQIHRESFALTLYHDGFDVDVPGVDKTYQHPWRSD